MGGYAQRWEEPTSGDFRVEKHLEYHVDRVLFRLSPDSAAFALSEAEADALCAKQSRRDWIAFGLAMAAFVALTMIWDDWASDGWQLPIIGAGLVVFRLAYDWAAPRLLFANVMSRPPVLPAVPLHRALNGEQWRDLWLEAAKQSAGVAAGAGLLAWDIKGSLEEGVGLIAFCAPGALRAAWRLWVKAFDKSLF